MAKKTKKSSKWEEDDWENDIPKAEESADTPALEADGEESTPVPDAEAKTPSELSEPQTASADSLAGDFMATLKKSKNKKQQKDEKEKEEKAKPNNTKGPIIKSKKEKEKEKKELEKQRKKEIAEKKKAAAEKKKAEAEAISGKHDSPSQKDSGSSTSGVKSGENEKNSSNVEDEAKNTAVEEKKPAAAGKKKKVLPNIAALKRQLELNKKLEEEQRLAQEEEDRQEREVEERAAEEERLKEEARLAKKERDRLKKEQLKAEGKYLTKKQKEEKKLQERRREQLLANSNVTVSGLQSGNNPKKVVYSDKKKKKKKSPSEITETDKIADKESSIEKNINNGKSTNGDVDENNGEQDDFVDDWEKIAEENGETVAEDWETVLKEEEDEKVADAKTAEPVETIKPDESISEKKDFENVVEPVEISKKKESEDSVVKKRSNKKSLPSQSEPDQKDLRSPICCILGHVDTGKTKLLDKIRQTNVQGGEAGGITQQIGATYFPIDAIKKKTAVMANYEKQTFDVPGLLIIDTPGHESFTNLRSRGSSLCNIAVLVVDIMHGLEQQTIESLRLLRDRKAPFIVALNKIDRLYDWKAIPDNSFRDSFAKQNRSVQSEFQDRLDKVKVALAEQGLNSELYFQNRNMAKYVSIVPTSAITGEGVPDLIWLLLELTQKRMSKQLMYLSKIEATILEVKVVEGFGTTIDVVLSNGILREGDRIVLCGLNGPIATNIRALLTPQPLRELRIKSEYVHNKEVKAALGVKIAANDLEKAVAGSRLLVVREGDDEEDMLDDVMEDLTGLLDSVDTTGRGVTVQASTLGSLEALLDFLKDMKIPVMSIGLGPVYKRDVMKATTMLDKAKEYAVMLCFDVKIDKEAEQYAEEQGIKIFSADIIYHLFDAFTSYQQKLLEQRRIDFMEYAILPCVLKTIQIINKRNPMIIGVDVMEGSLRVGTPICAVKVDPVTKERNILLLGKVVSLEVNHKSENVVKKGQTNAGVAMRLENPSSAQPVWGRHLDEKDNLYSLITRKSIDTLKDPAFRDTVARDDWLLIKNLKTVFDIK
ncbi:hypothetical protein PACTADRAFT_32802 [Pachysolen tannophilus NRRL Y-2460]|uniref:Eukaryotic translation initiation factor 5B n=1 Tax=Pachysolen tannophilus NRRL Y-2460 TaxID=669874 RepID=A0A1E4U016_PACTA|nr:hypothetical protein PACTADRAFT_32802 [Pachysolen tannophilus NRRL Y-2460]